MHQKDLLLGDSFVTWFPTFAEGHRFVAVQDYEALPEEADVEELVTPLNPVKVGILMNKLFPDL